MINKLTEAILLARQDRSQVARIVALAKSIPAMEEPEIDELIDRLLDFGDELEGFQVTDGLVPFDQILQPIVDQLARREANMVSEASDSVAEWSDQRIEAVTSIYRRCSATSDLRNHFLRWLGQSGQPKCLDLWTDLICIDPPQHRLGIVLAFAPLMQKGFQPSQGMLQRLLNEATSHSQIAPAVYDLFNFYYREKLVEQHPATSRLDALSNLLGQLCGQLGKIEEGNLPPDANASMINQLVSDSVALIVALCDTFAQLKYQDATGKIHQALSLRHRRVQTEAAAALAKLGDELGQKTLVELAQQPIARLRVLAYADELGFRDQISLELQGEIAIAESHLAIWLSEPAQMGLAPSLIEFMESREMYWPGYEHPVQCFLFRYEYGSGELSHSNVAICGPMTHAFAADIRHLPVEDIYAAFAGWQTVHNEIYLVSVAHAETHFSNQWRRLIGDLDAQGYSSVSPTTGASFFGQLILVADVVNEEEQPGTAIADGNNVTFYSQGNADAPIDWQMAYSIWRGHQMLNSFNPG